MNSTRIKLHDHENKIMKQQRRKITNTMRIKCQFYKTQVLTCLPAMWTRLNIQWGHESVTTSCTSPCGNSRKDPIRSAVFYCQAGYCVVRRLSDDSPSLALLEKGGGEGKERKKNNNSRNVCSFSPKLVLSLGFLCELSNLMCDKKCIRSWQFPHCAV